MGGSRPTRQESDRARAAKVAAAQERLEAEIARITTGDDWRRFLDLQARLHHYSANNVQLIWAQHADAFAQGWVAAPEPTYVAGFTTWKALGRSVERGQRGYAVLAPLRGARRSAVDDSGQRRQLTAGEEPAPTEMVESQPVLRGFTLAHVFDVSQTTGPALGEPPAPKLLAGEAPAGLGVAVMELVEAAGYSVDTVPGAAHIGGAKARPTGGRARWWCGPTWTTPPWSRRSSTRQGTCCCMPPSPAGPWGGGLKEVEAESVAFVVAAVHGMATDGYSFPYVAAWAGDLGARAVAATQARVAQAAKTIIAATPVWSGYPVNVQRIGRAFSRFQ